MKLIIDTDPGTDDAVAILIALAHFTNDEILGITTVAGNVPLSLTTKNALRAKLEASKRVYTPHLAQALRKKTFETLHLGSDS